MNKTIPSIPSLIRRLCGSVFRTQYMGARWCVLFVLMFFCMPLPLSPISALAQYEKIKPSQLKAVYIYNFINFISYTPNVTSNKKDNTVIAVLGHSPVNTALEELRASLILEKRAYFDIIKYYTVEDITDNRYYDILFIDAEMHNDFSKIFPLLEDRTALTVSDSEEFIKQGGIIALVERQGRIRFKINQKMALKKGIKLSSQLLKTAIHVTR